MQNFLEETQRRYVYPSSEKEIEYFMADTLKKGKEKHKRKINIPLSVCSVLVVQIVELLAYCL